MIINSVQNAQVVKPQFVQKVESPWKAKKHLKIVKPLAIIQSEGG